eukprot:7607748-Pyramimonas_sp.AAC.1
MSCRLRRSNLALWRLRNRVRVRRLLRHRRRIHMLSGGLAFNGVTHQPVPATQCRKEIVQDLWAQSPDAGRNQPGDLPPSGIADQGQVGSLPEIVSLQLRRSRSFW